MTAAISMSCRFDATKACELQSLIMSSHTAVMAQTGESSSTIRDHVISTCLRSAQHSATCSKLANTCNSAKTHLLTGALMKEAAADEACDGLTSMRKGTGVSFAAFSKQKIPARRSQPFDWYCQQQWHMQFPSDDHCAYQQVEHKIQHQNA